MRFLPRPLLATALLLLLAPCVRAEDPPAPPAPPAPPSPPAPPPAPATPAKAAPGRMGFSLAPVERLPPANRAALPEGAVGTAVVDVVPGSPAALAGLKVGDLLRTIQGRPVPSAENFAEGLVLLLEPIRVGDSVALEVERGGEKKTLTGTAVSSERIFELRRIATEGPPLSTAGPPKSFAEAFEAAGPQGFLVASGRWVVRPASDGSAAAGGVLKQEATVDPWAVVLFPGPGRASTDGSVTVRFRPISGREDASGGIVFRAQDAKNYYVVRANSLEGNLRLYSVKDGNRWQIAGIECDPPALGAWHTLSVEFRGKSMKATLNGTAVLEGSDDLFREAGWVGLWTKADSVTEFDDLVVTPASPPAPGSPPPPPKGEAPGK
jgi:hypothetical protein